MKIDKNYIKFIQSIKNQIVQSRYAAARLANRAQLLLYFNTGKMISDKIKAQKWGAKVLCQISADLQKELPGLKGFSPGNLKKIRIFAEAYSPHLTIGSTLLNQIGQADSKETFSIGSLLSLHQSSFLLKNGHILFLTKNAYRQIFHARKMKIYCS